VANRSNSSSGLLAGLLRLNLVVFGLVHEEFDSLLVILVALLTRNRHVSIENEIA
jgi:hypothetical protein